MSTYINSEEERTNGSSLRPKRSRMETISPKNEILLSLSSKNEVDIGITGNDFVTARTKSEMDVRQKRGMAESSNSSVSPTK